MKIIQYMFLMSLALQALKEEELYYVIVDQFLAIA